MVVNDCVKVEIDSACFLEIAIELCGRRLTAMPVFIFFQGTFDDRSNAASFLPGQAIG